MATRQPRLNRASIKKQIFLIVGAIMLVTGVTTYFVTDNIRKNICDRGQADYVYNLEPSISLVCKFQGGILEQNLTLQSQFFDPKDLKKDVRLPANAQIVDPDGIVLKNVNFDDKVSFSVKPETKGDYKAIITFLDKGDKKYDPVHNVVGVEFGFASRSGQLAATLYLLKPVAKYISYASAIFLGYGGLKLILGKRKPKWFLN